jgi:endonuclease/exonuclease/phosphatase (EEP) superfamily protein YafD
MWVLFAAWPVLALAFWSRHRRLSLVLAVVVLTHAYWSLEWVFNMHAPGRTSGTRVRVCAANLLAPNPSRAFASELLALRADVLVLEELSDEWNELLRERGVLARYPYRNVETHPMREDYFGLGILSRYPILDHERIVFGEERYPLLRVDLNIEGRRVRVYAVHTVPPVDSALLALQARQMDTLIAQLLGDGADPNFDVVLAAGDFNATPTSYEYRRLLSTGFAAAHELTGNGFTLTWPNGTRALPPMRLDHIFMHGGFALDMHKGRGEGSDHAPIYLDLVLPSVHAR